MCFCSSFYDNFNDIKCAYVMLKCWESGEWWLWKMWKRAIIDCDTTQWFGRVTEEVHMKQWATSRCPTHSNRKIPGWTFWALQLYQLDLLDNIKIELRHKVPWVNLMWVVWDRDQCRFLWLRCEILGCTESIYIYIYIQDGPK